MSNWQGLYIIAAVYLSRAIPPRAALFLGILAGIFGFGVHSGWWQ